MLINPPSRKGGEGVSAGPREEGAATPGSGFVDCRLPAEYQLLDTVWYWRTLIFFPVLGMHCYHTCCEFESRLNRPKPCKRLVGSPLCKWISASHGRVQPVTRVHAWWIFNPLVGVLTLKPDHRRTSELAIARADRSTARAASAG